MGGGDGILGNRDVERSKATLSITRRKWLNRQERWLVVLGVILHAVYMLSIFDIYFKTPIVHGMDPVMPRFNAPAKRLVLLIADGLRADKFFEPDSEGHYRAPFLRTIIKGQGRWGVSHARPPTESRPGHVAIIAGFYEDPSAVTKGWKANPVEFDSVFNRSRHTFAFGSPDIVPIFCGAIPHSTWNSYPHEFEDFATDASFLDEWSFDQFQSLLNRSNEDSKLKELLLQDNLVIFLHLLGCDSNGHAHRPFSSTYLNNVKVVDHIAERVYHLVEDYYKDNRTAYIFTADHGMSDKGSHGDGHPSNTDTPLVAWGAGVKYPKPISSTNHSHCSFRFVDDHVHDTPTPAKWGLDDLERVDVNQADIAPLMSTLLGLPCPANSVGSLPLDYISMIEVEEVGAVVANTEQILNQFLRKSYIKQSNSLHFKPFKPLANYSAVLDQIEYLISVKDHQAAMTLSENLRSLALQGLHYFQTYDWLMLMTVITLGYIGWMIYLVLHILQSYTSVPGNMLRKEPAVRQRNYTRKEYLCGCLFMGVISVLLFLEHSPPLYHAYTTMTVFLWTQIIGEYWFIKALWKHLHGRKFNYFTKLLATTSVSIFILEFLVNSFTDRKLYTWCFLIAGATASLYLFRSIPWRSGIPIFVCLSCWLLSLFTLMPAEIPDNNQLVIVSGVMIVLIGVVARWLNLYAEGKYWLSFSNHELKQPKFPMLFQLQALLVGLSSVMVSLSTSHRTQKQELLALHQLINWSIAGFAMVLPLFSANGLLSRLTSIFLGFAPAFLLLSIGYEAVFYSALALVLMAWILFENTVLYLSKVKKSSATIKNEDDNVIFEQDERCLQLSDVRIPLIFMVLFNVAFFGTGNFASIASFEISSVYRFITVFSPFLMTALLIFKLFIPFMLVICAFSAITKLHRLPRLGCYFLVILLSDVMTIHFFFLVRNTGSWMEIGNSISHFGIMSAQVVFVLLLFALTHMYTKGIQCNSALATSQKAIFSSGLEVANFVVASDVLRRSWSTVKELYSEINDGPSSGFSVRFKTDVRNPNYNIIAFVTWPPCARDDLQEGGADLVSSSALKGNFPLFEFLCTKTNPAFSIHKHAIQLFAELHGTLHFLRSQISDSKPLLVTGHGLGGSVAALFTLWLLEKMDFTKTKRPLCVTFGSPLIGDEGLQEAILQYSTWNSCFLHVVSQQDPLPRALISSNVGPPTEYKPFGTFLFCSEGGRCASFEDSESILELLKATYSEVPGNQNPNQGSQFFDYEEVLRQLHRNEICKDSTTLVLEPDTQPLLASISTQLVAIGLRQHQSLQEQQWHTLLAKTERQERQAAIWKRQIFDPSKKLNDMKINMAQLEWYKKLSKDKGTGYYDSYKNETNTGDLDVVKYKRILKCYWEELVAEVDKKPQKEGATFRTRWLFGGTNYRRMTEPLFIAEHYKNGKRDYIKTGRSEHYKLLEQWYNEDHEKAASDPLSKKANVEASLTDDSCFWALVEEARISCKLLSNGDSSVSTENHKASLIEFEAYVLGMLENYAVTPEIFLPKSSFMQWWSEYEEIIGQNFMGTAYVSRLTNWMRNRGYRDYASGNLLIP